MKFKLTLVMLSGFCVFFSGCSQRRNSASSGGAAAQGVATGIKAEAVDRMTDSTKILDELTSAPDSGIPDTILAKAKCVAIVPEMFRGGFVVGARYGRGVATCRNSGRWSAPAFFTVSGGSFGMQIGGQSTDLVMLFMDQDGAQKLLDANVKIGGGVSLAAGPLGRTAQASTDWKLESQILSYSRSKGLYAGATLQGAYVRVDEDTTRGFYGRMRNFRRILSGREPVPALAQPFVESVRKEFHESRM